MILADIETELGRAAYSSSVLFGGAEIPAQIISGSIDDWSDITQHFPGSADTEDLNVSIIDGSTISVYGFASEKTVVVLFDDGSGVKYSTVMVFDSAAEYDDGVTAQIPPAGVRS